MNFKLKIIAFSLGIFVLTLALLWALSGLIDRIMYEKPPVVTERDKRTLALVNRPLGRLILISKLVNLCSMEE